ncbi:DUF6538 domain-containing protein [Maritimibacter sp. 55A14]|uniref:DUF6538 domain-containing protein n=1 Tax=Maritimibacter sp. 55A14 TaxID=2174844 RepID=UPI0011B29497
MPGHARLYRRGAVYYHRAAVPQDIVETYGKREETFSLQTRDYTEALRKVDLPPLKWSAVMFRKTEDRNGYEAAQA